MNISLRRTDLVDLIKLQELFVHTISETCSEDYSENQINAWTSSVHNTDRWKRLITNQYSIVAEIDHVIVGLAALDEADYVDFLYVHSDYHRKGIATQLYNHLKLESLQQGYYKLISDVSITARPFFESQGFFVIKENKREINGVELTNYRMKER